MKKCVFCANGEGKTADHIPPRNFFDNPPPKNLVTVPCCDACRLRDQADDRLIRNIFISVLDVEGHRAIQSELGKRFEKSLHEDKMMLPRIAEMVVPAVIKLPGGISSITPALNFKNPKIARFLERVCRGVIYNDHGKTYFPAKFSWVQQPDVPSELMARAEPSIAQRAVGDIFHYFITETDGGDWFVVLTFFQKLQMLGKLTIPK